MKKIIFGLAGLVFLLGCTPDQKNTGQNHLTESNNLNQKKMTKIKFNSEGLTLTGNLYYPGDFNEDKIYPAIIVSGSWTTVKEQMAGLYAQRLAENGFITLAFDFRNFGESEGEPRFYENPSLKKEDIQNAVTYLESLKEVDNSRIGAYGVCAGAMYTLMAASEDKRIKSVVTAASWLHDAEAVKLFYGGDEGVNTKIKAAQEAKTNYAQNGVVNYIPTISTEDEGAAMYGPYDYYLNPERGAIKEWSADKFAVMSWEDWLTTDPMPTAKNLSCPTLMIHSDGAVLPQYTKNYFDEIASTDKKLHWIETEMESPFHQFNFYDQEKEVTEAVGQATSWFREKL
ncbi:MAG: alpha/beta hydrolase [Bacteroidota bacterium]